MELDILECIAISTVPPSMRELAKVFGWKQGSTAHRYVRLLVARGYLKMHGGKKNALVTPEGRRALFDAGRQTRPKHDGPEYVHKKARPPVERLVDYSDTQDPGEERHRWG